MVLNFLLVAIGGFFGSILRFFIAEKMKKHFLSTWIANITGSLLLAFLLKFHLANMLPRTLWALCGIGFCGAYTTFSTFGKETIELLFTKKYNVAFYYVVTSFAVSIAIVVFILNF